LQILEHGLIALSAALESPDPQPGWNSATSALAAIAKKKYPDRSDFEKMHGAFFEQITAALESVKLAWRNKVSHAHGKLIVMSADFSPDVAEEILLATRAFMRRLSTEGPLALKEPLA
jgi:hypothetical protein